MQALCSNGGEITGLSAETLEQVPNQAAQETIQKVCDINFPKFCIFLTSLSQVIAVHKKHWPCLTGVQGINTLDFKLL
jgi:hypothetical protein